MSLSIAVEINLRFLAVVARGSAFVVPNCRAARATDIEANRQRVVAVKYFISSARLALGLPFRESDRVASSLAKRKADRVSLVEVNVLGRACRTVVESHAGRISALESNRLVRADFAIAEDKTDWVTSISERHGFGGARIHANQFTASIVYSGVTWR